MSDTNINLPQKLYLLGGGRDPSTRAQRRANRFRGRAFFVGGIPIRPNRRIDVSLAFVLANFDVIVEKVTIGSLIVQHDGNSFLTVDELNKLRDLSLGDETDEIKADETETKADETETKATDPVDPPPAVPPSAPEVPETTETSELGVEPGFDETPETTNETTPAVAETTDETEPVVVPEDDDILPEPEREADLPDEEPVDVAEESLSVEPEDAPDLTEPEPTVEKRYLPEGWETRTKKEMLALCEERGITIEGRPNNDKLIEILSTWLAG